MFRLRIVIYSDHLHFFLSFPSPKLRKGRDKAMVPQLPKDHAEAEVTIGLMDYTKKNLM